MAFCRLASVSICDKRNSFFFQYEAEVHVAKETRQTSLLATIALPSRSFTAIFLKRSDTNIPQSQKRRTKMSYTEMYPGAGCDGPENIQYTDHIKPVAAFA